MDIHSIFTCITRLIRAKVFDKKYIIGITAWVTIDGGDKIYHSNTVQRAENTAHFSKLTVKIILYIRSFH